jgi:cysteinyl-tRNA synthetase
MADEQRLTFHNTFTKRREAFVPRASGVVKLFTCGPSVYRRQHLGNYRTFLFEDILQRYLEYRGYTVHRAINFTDVEDKAVEEAREKGVTLQELTQPVIDEFLDSCARLGISLPGGEIPRSTTSVEQAVEMIEALIERGHAYHHDGNVYYDPLTYPGFGEVFGLDMSKWPKKRVRFSRDTYEGLRWNLGDFILWHGNLPDDGFSWSTRLGQGRPAWNVQDPAMISKTLGYEIDIHTGGIDNVYRHHDYNRAVMEGISGSEFCHYWIHGEHLVLEGRKMSKSKGNVLYPQDLFDRGYSQEVVRFSLINGHYRRRLNMTDDYLSEAASRLERIRDLVARTTQPIAASGDESGRPEAEANRTDRVIDELPRLFELNMDNDVQVDRAVEDLHGALSHIHRRGERFGTSDAQARRVRDHVAAIDRVLGVIYPQ